MPSGRRFPAAEQIGTAERIIRYKSAKYTVERPLQLGAAVAGPPARELPVRVRPAAGGGVPAAGRRAGRVRRPRGDRQTRRGGHPRGQADPAAGAGPGGPARRSSGSSDVPGHRGATGGGHHGRPRGPGRLRGPGTPSSGGSPAWPGRPGPRSRLRRTSRTTPGPPCSRWRASPPGGIAEMTGPVVVIGAGLAGLAAAIHLAAAGRDVTVVEASDGPGGCCGTATAGPTGSTPGPRC